MPAYAVDIEIDAPPLVVFAYVADLIHHGEWSADPLEIRAVEGSGAVGGRYASTARSKGKTITAQITVTECDPGRIFAFEVIDLTGRYQHTFTLIPDGEGTRLQRRITTSDLSLAQLALFYLVYPTVKRPNARRAMRALKSRLEGARRGIP